MSEPEWIENRIAELVAEHGSVPPPWFMFPNTHPYDICWRMGAGESHVIVFGTWWDRQRHLLAEPERIALFRRWSPPPRWLVWTMEAIWDLDLDIEGSDEDAIDASPYFARMEALGFATEAEFRRDFDDPRWLGKES